MNIKKEFIKIKKEQDKHVPIIRQLIKEYGPCAQCGLCCQKERVTITKIEAFTLDQEWYKCGVYKMFDKFVAFNVPCPYYMDNKCGVYEHRPNVCRNYPFIFIYPGSVSIAYCELGQRVINDVIVYAKDIGVGVREGEEDPEVKESIDDADRLYERLGLKTPNVATKVLHIPFDVFDDFVRWRRKQKGEKW